MTADTSRRPKPALLVAIGAVIVAALVAIFILAGGGTDQTASTPAGPEGPPAPTTQFEYFDGTTATLAAYEGEPLVVNFWASWCPSCVAEMSSTFRPVQQELGDEVAFLGFNIQDERSKALDLVEETGVLFDLAEDRHGDIYSELGGLGMPFTVFVSPDGTIVHKHNGPLSQSQLVDLIDKHLLGA